MKKVITILMIFVSLLLFSIQSFAHPGRTDSRGGHYDRSTGEYHYHTGEFAGREQSSSSYSTKEYETYDPDIWQERGLDDGLRQLCEDTMYKNSFKEGFNDAAEEYFKFRPVLKSIFKNDKRDIFYIDFYHYNLQYSTVKLKNYKKHFPSHSFYYTNYKTYGDNYDNSYKNGSVANAPVSYKYSEETKQVIQSAKTEGYNYFYDSCIYAYKENYPVEAFFTTMPIIFVVIFIISVIAIILFFKWAIKSNRQKTIHIEENQSIERITTDVPKVDESKENKEQKPQYQSLIPEFIPTNTAKQKKPKTEIPTHEYISQKQYDIYKRRFFIIGETIAEGTYFFSKINESEPAYFSSKTEDTPITRNKQRFFLVKGEKIFLFNCKLEPEE